MSSRKEFVEKLKAELDTWNNELDRLEESVKELSADLKKDGERQYENLRKNCAELSEKFKKTEKAREEAKEFLTETIETAWGEIKSSFDKIANALNPEKPDRKNEEDT
jgi:chromosome segregation ATPase